MATDLQQRLQATLGDAFTLRRELGRGGMSRVFVAEDVALGREVVVKVLSPDLGAGVSVDRFRREIAMTARLQHPRIVPIFAAGELEGLPYYTMPLVEGESLRDRLRRDGALPINEAVRVMRDVADTLAYAHERGIVHRDIKPDNVLLSAGGAMVVDFGVAKAVSAATDETHAGLTSIGLSIGTPAYMAPEQALGDPDVDHRADLYSLGAMAYEMFAGQPVFGYRPAAALVGAHIAEQPKPLETLRPDVPALVADLVMRCLAKQPADRPQRAQEIVNALEGVPRTPTAITSVVRPRPSLAVLPFANLSSDPENEFLCDGITEEILTALGRLPGVRVAARTSSFALKKSTASVQEQARALNAESVVEGSVRRAGNRLRVNAQLVAAADGYQIWSDRYDRELADVFEIQDEIASAIVAALRIAIYESPSGLHPVPPQRKQTRDLVAYELYLRGRHFRDHRTDGMWKAMDFYRRALERDPDYALAQAGVAEGYYLLTLYAAIPPNEGTPKARDAAHRALELDPSLAEPYVVLGNASLWYDRDLDAATAHFERAIALQPSDALAHSCLAFPLAASRRFNEAIDRARRSVEIDPLGQYVRSNFAIILYLARRFPDVIEQCRAILEIAPGYSDAHRWTALAQLHMGEAGAAIESMEMAVQTSGRNVWYLSNQGGMLARLGQRDAALALRAEVVERAKSEPVAPFLMAVLAYGLGEMDATFEWLERSLEAHDAWLIMLGSDPGFSGLRKDPRFTALAERIGLQ